MKRRAINLREHEVCSILEDRMTQIRRVLNPQPSPNQWDVMTWRQGNQVMEHLSPLQMSLCSYGQPGDVLWAREVWAVFQLDGIGGTKEYPNVLYKANSSTRFFINEKVWKYNTPTLKWRSPAQMPAWVSRIKLEVVNTRIERLQDITEEDARASGIVWKRDKGDEIDPRTERSARDVFPITWNAHITETGHSWNSNPWVRVGEFKRLK